MSATSSSRVVQALQQVLDPGQLSRDPADLQFYGRDWTRFIEPNPLAVVFPRSTEQVRDVVRIAGELGVALVPSGGRTGLSGGAVAAQGEVVVSMDRMRQMGEVNRLERTIRVGAGVVTREVQEAAAKAGLFYPVDFASSGTSQIGGNVATNAGGIRVIRYGMTREWVAGLTVVDGTGQVLELNRGLVKNNSGLDLRHLMIGSEGILGLITEVELRLTQPPAPAMVFLLGVKDFEAIHEVFRLFRQLPQLMAFEFFSDKALEKVLEAHSLQRPFETMTPYFVLVELETTQGAEDAGLAAFEEGLAADVILDGTMSQSEAQARALWALRENISETISVRTPYKNDISVRVGDMGRFVNQAEQLVKTVFPTFEIIWFGHIGDGNLHLNILCPESMEPEDFKKACEQVNERVVDLVKRFGGSISAEHGIGLLKKRYLTSSRSEAEIEHMKAIKRVFDPLGILNPGKVL
jgi:FAD/FMN-containing dehydrogenase